MEKKNNKFTDSFVEEEKRYSGKPYTVTSD